MPTSSLDDLNLENEPEKKISSTEEPTGSEDMVPTNFWEGGDVSGEITTRDKKWTRLNIGQKAGNIGEDKGFGSLVANRTFVVIPGFPSNQNQGPLLPGVTVIKFQKAYQEKRAYDPSATSLPRMFRTSQEANEAGFSTEYGVSERFVQPVAAMLFLVPAPNGLDPDAAEQLFQFEHGGTRLMAAGFFAAGTSWFEAAKPVLTALDTPKCRSFGDNALRSSRWSMSIIRRTGVKGAWYAMKLAATGGYNAKEFIDYTRQILP